MKMSVIKKNKAISLIAFLMLFSSSIWCESSSMGFDLDRLKLLDSAMAKFVADGKVAGMSYLLMRHNEIVDFKVMGKRDLESGAPMERDTIVRIYSMTKPITGVAMMILFEQGKWQLDDPVTKFIPEFQNLKVMTGQDKKGNPILIKADRAPTMREIMSHTAGFGYGLNDKHRVDKLYQERHIAFGSSSLKEMINNVAAIPLKFQPGTDWAYSIAVDIQGYLVEKLSGQKFSEFLAQKIFEPLKMKDTAFFTGPQKASRLAQVYAANQQTGKLEIPKELFKGKFPDYTKVPEYESGGAGLVSTLDDYARFIRMILNKGALDGVRILSPQTVALMSYNVVPSNVRIKSNAAEGFHPAEALGFGLDLEVTDNPLQAGLLEGKGTLSWAGAAGTWFWIDPTNDLLFVGILQRLGGLGGENIRSLSNPYLSGTHSPREINERSLCFILQKFCSA